LIDPATFLVYGKGKYFSSEPRRFSLFLPCPARGNRHGGEIHREIFPILESFRVAL
jgi:hypothetical protein